MSNNKKELMENTVSEKELYTGKYFSCKIMTVETDKGYAQREIVDHPGTIMVIAVTEDEKLVLNRVYRKSIDKYSLEMPSKRIDSNDNYLEVIKEELLYEQGYEVLSIRSAHNYYPSISYSNEKVYMYAARVKKVREIGDGLSYHIEEKSIEKIKEELDKLDIIDAKTIIGINYICDMYNQKKQQTNI